MCKNIPQREFRDNIPKVVKSASIDEALEKTGFGKYNIGLLLVCSWMLNAMGLDLFGMSFTVTAAVCDLKLTMEQSGMLAAMPFIGVIAGAHLWGFVSDTKGRKFTLKLSMSLGFFFAALSSLSPNWETMAVIKFFSSCFTSATNSATYTLIGESFPEGYRSKSMLLMTCALMFSQGVAAALSYPILPLDFSIPIPFLSINFTSWRLLVIVMAFPCLITACLLEMFLESPKFLLTQGREQEALNVLKKMYAWNTGNEEDDYPVTKLVQEDHCIDNKIPTSFFKSVWRQTVPLFQPPFLRRTLQLFYLTMVIYMTASGFIMWLPYIMNNIFVTIQSESGGSGMNLCTVLHSNETVHAVNATMSIGLQEEQCDSTIQPIAIISAITYGSMVTLANLVMSLISGRRKKLAIFTILSVSLTSSLLINLVNVPIAGIFIFFFFLMIALAMGIISVYFVELYPTNLRGMASCLSVLVARASAFVGVNLIGLFLNKDCSTTFYAWSGLICTAVFAATFLPSDKKHEHNMKKANDLN